MKGWILNLTLGLILLAGGGFLTWYELSHPPTHSPHVYAFLGVAILGALLINPTPIISSVKQVTVIILPFVPWAKKPTTGTDNKMPTDKLVDIQILEKGI